MQTRVSTLISYLSFISAAFFLVGISAAHAESLEATGLVDNSYELAAKGAAPIVFSDGLACVKNSPGRIVKSKKGSSFVSLNKLLKSGLSPAQRKSQLDSASRRCRGYGLSEINYVDPDLPRECALKGYDSQLRKCTAKGKSRAFKTLRNALAYSGPGDVVLLRTGKKPYSTNVVISDGGTDQRPLTVKGAPGERVVFEKSGILIGATPKKGKASLRVNSVVLENLEFKDSTGSAIALQNASAVRLTGLKLYKTGTPGAAAAIASISQTDGLIIESSLVSGFSTGISLSSDTTRVLIRGNIFRRISNFAIQDNSTVGGNLILKNEVSGGGQGIYLAGGAGTLVHHNIISFLTGPAIELKGNASLVHNSVIGASRGITGAGGPNAVVRDNLTVGSTVEVASGSLTNNVAGDVSFLAGANALGSANTASIGDFIEDQSVTAAIAVSSARVRSLFALSSNSPALDVATASDALALEDFFGTAPIGKPDVGAIESGALTPPPAIPNLAPVSDAGKNLIVQVGVPIRLDGSGSFDPENALLQYAWTVDSVPEGSSLIFDGANASVANPLIVADVAGDYVFSLIVSDGEKQSEKSSIAVKAVSEGPTVNARITKHPLALVGNPVELRGYSVEDSILLGNSPVLLWSLVSAPEGSVVTNESFSNRGTELLTFTPDVVGKYSISFSVTVNGSTSVETAELNVTSSNVGPIAVAGKDFALSSGTATLNASQSSDPDSLPFSPITYAWRLVSKPDGSNLTNDAILEGNSALPTFVPDVEGSYVFRVTVSDGEKTDSDNVLVFFEKKLPNIAIIAPKKDESLDTLTPMFKIAFDDRESLLELSTLKLLINQTDVSAGLKLSALGASYLQTQPLPAGDNEAIASIKDKAGNEATFKVHFVVASFRALPDCRPSEGVVPLKTLFRTRGEFTEGSIVLYRWDFNGDGTFDSSDQIPTDLTYTFSQPGTYVAKLEVTNNFSKTTSGTCTIKVEAAPPTAFASASPSNGPVPLSVTFTGGGTKKGGTLVKFEWDFDGDGTFDSVINAEGAAGITGTKSVTHVYQDEGAHNATFRVTDNEGKTAVASVTTTSVRVGPPGSPSVTATANVLEGTAPLVVNLGGSALDDGQIAKWEWDFDGDGVYDYSSVSSPQIQHTFTDAGIFKVALRATDDSGLSSVAYLEIKASLKVSLSIADDTLTFIKKELLPIKVSLSAPSNDVWLYLKDEQGAKVRTLSRKARPAGEFTESWDGLGDGDALLPEGVYYVVVDYTAGGQNFRLDLTDSTGGAIYSPPRSSIRPSFKPFENDPLAISFTISPASGASEVIAYMGTFYADVRFVTLVERTRFGAGSHVLYWDGLDPNGKLAVPPPGDRFLFGMFAYTLADNAILLERAPSVSNPVVSPTLFSPSQPSYIVGAVRELKITYDLDQPALVEAWITNLASGIVIRRMSSSEANAGTGKSFTWDGKTDSGVFADKGSYQFSVRARDPQGSTSMIRTALFKVFH